MRKIDKLSLTKLSKNELEARQMNALKGGTNEDSSCVCNCYDGSTQSGTRNANSKYGYQYSYGGDGTYGEIVICSCRTVSMATARGGM